MIIEQIQIVQISPNKLFTFWSFQCCTIGINTVTLKNSLNAFF